MKPKDSKRRWRPGLVLALCLALGALVLAGCGGSSGASGSSTAETSTTASAAGAENGGSENGGSENGGSESGSAENSGAEGGKGGPGMMNISAKAKTCLKEKGVELPEFKGGEGGLPSGGEAPEGTPEGGKAGGMPEGGEPPQGGEGGPVAGGFGGEGSEEMTKAFEECGVEMPEFRGGPGGAGAPNMNTAAFKKQVKEYVACVRENGYELADPDFSGEGPVFAKEESESAAFKKASAKCQSLLGGPTSGTAEGGSEA